jgi:hypothetical protein
MSNQTKREELLNRYYEQASSNSPINARLQQLAGIITEKGGFTNEGLASINLPPVKEMEKGWLKSYILTNVIPMA